MRFRSCVLGLLCCTSPGRSALAADWWFVPTALTGTAEAMVYIDKSSMQRLSRSGRVSAWVWTIYRADRTSEFGSYRSAKHRTTVDCETREVGAERSDLYSAYGALVHRHQQPSPLMGPITPESPDDTVATFMCSDGKQPPRSIPVYDPTKDVEQRFLQSDRERR